MSVFQQFSRWGTVLGLSGVVLGWPLPILEAQRSDAARDSLYSAIRAEATQSEHPGLIFLHAARSLLAVEDLDGLDPYFHGALYDDSASVAEYRHDLEPLWSQAEAEGFARQKGAARVEWLREFWRSREQALRRPGERVAEHYRRLAYAREHYPRPEGLRTYQWWEKVRTGSWDFDDRGLIYVRHGPPLDVRTSWDTRREATTEADVAPGDAVVVPGTAIVAVRPAFPAQDGPGTPMVLSEIWSYGGDPELMFFFRSCASFSSVATFNRTYCGLHPDFRLVESPLDFFAPDPRAAIRDNKFSFDQRTARLLGLHDLLSGRFASPRGRADELTRLFTIEREGRESLDRGMASETYDFSFPRTVEGRAEVVSLGNQAGSAEVMAQVAFAVRTEHLVPTRLPDGTVTYPLRLRIELKGRQGRVVTRHVVDRSYAFAAPLGKTAYLMGLEVVPIAEPVFTAEMIVQQGVDRGMTLRLVNIETPILETIRPDVSPLVIGRQGGDLGYPVPGARGDTIYFNPSAVVTNADPLEVTWEVYGAPADVPLHVDLQVTEQRGKVERALGADEPQLRFGFEDLPSGPVHLVRRTIDISRLRPARYRVTVTITFANGRVQTRESDLEIVSPGALGG